MPRRIVDDYVQASRAFSANARRFLWGIFLSWIGVAVHQVIFNLYLVAAGHDEDFAGRVASMLGVGMAVVSLPAGFLADRLGRRATLRAGALVLALALLARSLTVAPWALFAGTFLLGAGQALLAIAAAPFLSENSQPRERTHLFSMHFGVILLAGVAGNLLGGALPGPLQRLAPSLAPGALTAYRWTLALGALVSLAALGPLAAIREVAPARAQDAPPRERLRDHAPLLLKLGTNFALVGIGAGLVMPFFNLYFARRYGASAGQIGVYFSVAQVTTLVATLAGPLIARRWGKLNAITVLQLASLPFLLTLGFETSLPVSVLAFWGRAALMQMASPLLNSYAMDVLPPSVRARAHGIDTMVWYVGWSGSSALAGWVIARFGWAYPYDLTAFFYAVATLVFYRGFRGRPQPDRAGAPGLAASAATRAAREAPGAGPSSGL